MHDLIINIFGSGSFIPHGHCYLWKPSLVWLHLSSDALIGLAYYSIPLTLFHFVRKRKDLPFHWIFLLFAAFIISCGTTHFASIWTLWYPTYWLSGGIKAVTAVVSMYTALELVPLVPKALALPSPAQLEQANQALKAQIEERLRVEAQLRHFQNELEARVQSRTVELVQVNGQLQQEIEERQCAEAALREQGFLLETILKYTADAIIVCDAKGKLTFANPQARRLAQQDPNGTNLDFDLFNWGTAKDADGNLIPLENYAVSKALRGEVSYAIESRMVRNDGSYYDILVSAAPLLKDGQIVGAVGSFIDITDRKHAETEREQLLAREQAAREQAEAANRIKDEFLAVLSHELRSPLNPILGWAKLLQTRHFDEQKTKEALATIERNARLQTQLIDDLLDVSRILQGKLVLHPNPVNLVNTIEAAIETVRLAAQAKGIQIHTNFAPNVGQVMGDSARLQQVVWNLLSNAVKFTASGGKVEIKLEKIDIYAQIQVKDTGKGIDPDFLPYVFEYFRQEDGTTTRRFGGLGLGLAIVRHLVELHGGTVQAESPGQGLGATFTVKLPLMPISAPRLQENPQNTQVASLSEIQILVVDDEPDIQDIVSFILEQAGATVRTAVSAAQALQQIEQSLPDVLVCDIGMPDIDGYMLMRQIRQLPPERGGQISAIALTAYAREIDQQQAKSAGFQQHIAKPVEPEVLVSAIASLIAKKST
ncbi:ATP-binding protein [Aerosakkonemataceae cyanobacterium BLCC-F50]|uniref:histidine kinase n=1 Tax=Floridaenema flaviceps BLCC-F50 TaxID=3153642 RepID=A0ABV4XVF4_9CYAN